MRTTFLLAGGIPPPSRKRRVFLPKLRCSGSDLGDKPSRRLQPSSQSLWLCFFLGSQDASLMAASHSEVRSDSFIPWGFL